MSSDGSAAGRSAAGVPLDVYARAIVSAFPDLRAERVSLLGEGWDSVAVETAEVVFRFPKREYGARSQAKEGRLLPLLREHLTTEVPLPQYVAAPSERFPFGFSGYRRIAGRPLRPERVTEPLAEELARFLAELHRFPVDRALELGVPGVDRWRPGHERLRAETREALRKNLARDEFRRVDRWWEGFLSDDRLWRFVPRLTHCDLGTEHILVDETHHGLIGVIDWGDAAVADPAIDLVGLFCACGGDFTSRVAAAYFERGMPDDPVLPLRVRRYATLVPFHAVHFAVLVGGPDGPSMDEAIESVRRTDILAGGGEGSAW
jgi:aminoglycoside 2''-phosphotransferase